MGRTYWQEGLLAKAVPALTESFTLFTNLNSPEREVARQLLANLRYEMGVDEFEAALHSAELPIPDGLDKVMMTFDQLAQYIVDNTIAVLTQAPEKKAIWCTQLDQFRTDVQVNGLETFVTFIGLVQQLVEGARTDELSRAVPEDFHTYWGQIVKGCH